MRSVVCTLFEGAYHFGLGALVNSLYRQGFRSTVWAGYRGQLPPWAYPCTDSGDYKTYRVADGCQINFVPQDTTAHFARFKPDFMLHLFERFCPDVDQMFYFDPDITVRCRWSFFDEWLQWGIALCEDRRSPLYAGGPQKMEWLRFFKNRGVELIDRQNPYVNSGFIGLSREQHKPLLNRWRDIQNLVNEAIGPCENLIHDDPSFAFACPDQDALNIALMGDVDLPASILNKQAMSFNAGEGGFVMCHAIGPFKPWRKRLLIDSLAGRIPLILDADREFMLHADSPIRLYSPLYASLRNLERRLSTVVLRIRGA